MNLIVDGRTVQLDESATRVVIEKSSNNEITITSHFGVRKQIIAPSDRLKVDHGSFVGPTKPVNNNGHESGTGRKPRQPGSRNFISPETRKAMGKRPCPDCSVLNHNQQKVCTSCGRQLRGVKV